jgi:hypothetical protein
MSQINTAKVITGGLVAGIVFNLIDFVINGFMMRADYAANASRLGLDPASMETPAAMASWVIIDFILGFVVVFLYAAIRPRFGAGAKTAIFAGLILWVAITSMVFGFAQIGLLTTALVVKMLIPTLVNVSAGSVAGAWVYKEA